MTNSKTEVKNEEAKMFTAQDFQFEYEMLCRKMGLLIVPSLTWVARDDGTWSTKVNLTVGQLPKPIEPDNILNK